MLTKRIIPCLDVKGGRTVKGVNFDDIRDAGDPLELAKKYVAAGADELVFLDISATEERRKTLCDLVTRIASGINIPFAVGGGVASIDDAYALLLAGADKVSVNSAAVRDPGLIAALAKRFGSQCVMLAVDIKLVDDTWMVFSNGGKVQTNWRVIDWVKKGEELGAGEILLTSIGNDGTKSGFAIGITKQVTGAVNIPVIASGGAGKLSDFSDVFLNSGADAALAASVFHYGEIEIQELKQYLKNQKIAVR
jgi:cyclase